MNELIPVGSWAKNAAGASNEWQAILFPQSMSYSVNNEWRTNQTLDLPVCLFAFYLLPPSQLLPDHSILTHVDTSNSLSSTITELLIYWYIVYTIYTTGQGTHFSKFSLGPAPVSRPSLRITSKVLMQLRTMRYHILPCRTYRTDYFPILSRHSNKGIWRW